MSLFAQGPLPVLVARELALGYGSRRLLEGVEISIMPGEFWFVVGANGAGKSTLIRALLGLMTPQSGSLALARELDDRQRLGFVPQRCTVAETVPVTVREFVLLGCTGLRLGRDAPWRRVAAALDQVGLTGCALRDLRTLSGGERQRALIARALVRQPLLLVVDEPTAGLDLVAQRELMALLANLNRQGLTVVFVAHDLALVAGHGSHVALLAQGRVRTGLADEVLTPANLERAFGLPVAVQREGAGITVHVGGAPC